jgi:hypothetical protein
MVFADTPDAFAASPMFMAGSLHAFVIADQRFPFEVRSRCKMGGMIAVLAPVSPLQRPVICSAVIVVFADWRLLDDPRWRPRGEPAGVKMSLRV